MELILLEKVHRLGGLGDRVNVRSGYGRNYLIPQGKAVFATAANIERFETRRAELEAKAVQDLTDAKARAEKLAAVDITLTAKAADEGKLYGSVGIRDIVEAVKAQGAQLEKQEVDLLSGPIRALGEHEVVFRLHTDVEIRKIIKIVPEK